MIDIHSHVLPGIDDGAENFADSVAILRGLSQQGITDVIATPHYVTSSSYKSTAVVNQQLLKALNHQVKLAKIPIRVYLGNEIYIDPQIASLLRVNHISPLAGSRFVLVELPMSGEYVDYSDILMSLVYEGYQVILAHPERYHTIQNNFTIAEELVEQGILLQCNLGSFIGQYGRHAKKTVRKLAKKHMIFAFGTDIHRQRDYSEITLAQRKLRRYYKKDELNQVLVKNPAMIICSRRRKK